jgi:rRNA maturation RNase YbeY
MTRLNETFLRHAGSTDVIAFDYAEDAVGQASSPSSRTRTGKMSDPRRPLHGEIFVCMDEAILQARRFRTSWQAEVVRYVVHGTLHLLGYDDQHAADRRRMKREEDRLCAVLAARFALSQLARKPRLRA